MSTGQPGFDPHAKQGYNEDVRETKDAARTPKPRYRVRKQSSGYTFSETFYVIDSQRGNRRVSVHASTTREGAQADADELNIGAMVKDYVDDPRPYDVRRAEAEAAFRSTP